MSGNLIDENMELQALVDRLAQENQRQAVIIGQLRLTLACTNTERGRQHERADHFAQALLEEQRTAEHLKTDKEILSQHIRRQEAQLAVLNALVSDLQASA
jgi:hypothetical protein